MGKKIFLILPLILFTSLGLTSIVTSYKSSAAWEKAIVPHNIPFGCNKAFQETSLFRNFYDSTAAIMALKNGSTNRSVVDMFAVYHLRNKLNDLIGSKSVENPIDRLIIAQICNYKKVLLDDGVSPDGLTILSDDLNLQKHMALVSARLYRDSRKLYLKAKQELANNKSKHSVSKYQLQRVNAAKANGKSKVKAILR